MFTNTTTNEKVYTVSQLITMTGVSKNTLKQWQKDFTEFFEKLRVEGDVQRYRQPALELIERIKRLVEVDGYAPTGAKRILQEIYGSPEWNFDERKIPLNRYTSSLTTFQLRQLYEKVEAEQL